MFTSPDQIATRPYVAAPPPTRLVRQTPTDECPVQAGPAFHPTLTGPRPHWTRPDPAPAARRRPWWRRWYVIVPAVLIACTVALGVWGAIAYPDGYHPATTTAAAPAQPNLCDKAETVHSSSPS
jgi:hypothetical protein